ncbi:MAG: hypothetical protein CVU10_08870 [Bacteroidetes bacterium HGW-Bacteroidetes-5]|nr:MAG: hypothetical protein CVU10_08870 [Bacteroidetes bacterium HGW-Bacteroidetes-5]
MIYTDFLNKFDMKSFKLLLAICMVTLLHSCTGGPQLMPNISGKAGEVVVVINKGDWESEAGVALRGVLAVDQQFLPQREPLFTLVNIPENAFTSIFQTHRNIIIVKVIESQQEPKIALQENVWAAPQIVVTISGSNELQISEIIARDQERLRGAMLMAERNRNIQNAKRYEEKSLRAVVTDEFGGSPYFPKGYSLKKRIEDFIWISYETTYTNQGIFIYSFPYRDSTDFLKENLIAKRNEILGRNVPGQVEKSYMTTNMLEESGLKWIRYNKRDFAELRGLWEVQNDFMGGPFVSHFFIDKENMNIIALESFVYAPRYDKRNYLRQVESLIYSFEFF